MSRLDSIERNLRAPSLAEMIEQGTRPQASNLFTHPTVVPFRQIKQVTMGMFATDDRRDTVIPQLSYHMLVNLDTLVKTSLVSSFSVGVEVTDFDPANDTLGIDLEDIYSHVE